MFNKVTFAGTAEFGEVNFSQAAGFMGVDFNGGARFDKTRFGGIANFNQAGFDLHARFDFDEVRVRTNGNQSPDKSWSWPTGLTVTEPNEQDAILPGQDGRWGHLKLNTSDKPKAGESQT
jgi:hypothetical protein